MFKKTIHIILIFEVSGVVKNKFLEQLILTFTYVLILLLKLEEFRTR